MKSRIIQRLNDELAQLESICVDLTPAEESELDEHAIDDREQMKKDISEIKEEIVWLEGVNDQN